MLVKDLIATLQELPAQTDVIAEIGGVRQELVGIIGLELPPEFDVSPSGTVALRMHPGDEVDVYLNRQAEAEAAAEKAAHKARKATRKAATAAQIAETAKAATKAAERANR
jgi:hypothetical protein